MLIIPGKVQNSRTVRISSGQKKQTTLEIFIAVRFHWWWKVNKEMLLPKNLTYYPADSEILRLCTAPVREKNLQKHLSWFIFWNDQSHRS